MSKLFFFDLPVYRLGDDIYSAQRDRDIEERILAIAQGHPGYEIPKSTKIAIAQHAYAKYGPWIFNEIIGYIRLYFLGSQIRGEYFSAEKRHNGLGRHKVFLYKTPKLAPETDIYPRENASNAQIFSTIQKYIEECKSELVKCRVIDDSVLMTIGPYLDWRSLLKWESVGR